jgi:hypothetical protein
MKIWSCLIYRDGTFSGCKLLVDSTYSVVWRSILNVTGWNWSTFVEIWKFHIYWPYWPSVVEIDLQTTKYVHMRVIWNQKSAVSIYRATSNFDLHMRIFNQSSRPRGFRKNQKKKVRRNFFYILLQLFKGRARSIFTKL